MDWDRRLARHAPHLRLHQPHAAARGAGEMAGRPVRTAAAAPPRDHLRNQPALPRRGARDIPGDDARLARLSLIDEGGERSVRMAHLATVGSHHVNGVAQLHSDLLARRCMRDFAELWPEKFLNVTNGVTPRRFIALSNPPLARLITERIGDGWLRDLRSAPQAGAAGRRRGLPEPVARGETRRQARSGGAHPAAHRHHGRARTRSSTSRSSACTNTSGST